jgi:hypothetical protein
VGFTVIPFGRMALLTVAAFAAWSQPLWGSSVCATVTDVLNGPIQGAVVAVVDLTNSERRFTAQTDSAGKVCVDKVPDGRYSVEAGASGFVASKYYPVRIDSPREVTFSFRLPIVFNPLQSTYVGFDATVYGTLADGANPLADVTICLFVNSKKDAVRCAATNNVGQYSLIVPPGFYEVEVSRTQVKLYSTVIQLPNPGYYRNALSLRPTR